VSIAVDPAVIPYDSKVYIDGKEYIAHDCGGAIKGKRIDVYFESHQDALAFGVQYENVEVEE
jgi:3D (Asp-Asp-Asp) domain-containing protein